MMQTTAGRHLFGNRLAPDGSLVAENFDRWWSDSKVATEDGIPLVVYHGTSEIFPAFDLERCGQNGCSPQERGFFFTEDASLAEQYATLTAIRQRRKAADTFNRDWRLARHRGNDAAQPTLIAVYLSLRNPAVLDMKGASATAHRTATAIRLARARGHDSLQIVNVDDNAYGERCRFSGHDTVWVAFEPHQIKSAIGNSGLFDPHSPDFADSHAWESEDEISRRRERMRA